MFVVAKKKKDAKVRKGMSDSDLKKTKTHIETIASIKNNVRGASQRLRHTRMTPFFDVHKNLARGATRDNQRS